MPGTHSFIRRALAVAALAAMLGATALNAPAAGADPTPPRLNGGIFNAAPISAIAVHAGGHEATLSFATAEPTTVTVDYKPLTAMAGSGGPPRPILNVGDGTANSSALSPATIGQGTIHFTYRTTHDLKLTGLKSNTSYAATITATTKSNQTLTAQQTFTTLRQRVRLTLDHITITDDGDWFGDGEPTWYWQVLWNTASMKDCYPQSAGRCKEGSEDEGTITPLTASGQKFAYVLAEENFQPIVDPMPQPGSEDFSTMPQSLRLLTTARESDVIPNPFDLVEFQAAGQATWQVPKGVERAEQQVTLKANADGFRSTMTFTFQLFYDNQTYQPNDGRVHSSSK